MRRRAIRLPAGAARKACAGAGLAAAAVAAQGQTATGISITPTFSVSETITDNRDLSSTDRQADAITVVTPGVRVQARSDQLNGGLTLGVNAIHYARASERDQTSLQTALDSAFHYQALGNRFYLDATATAQQQAISAFGKQSAGTTLIDTNRSQVTTVTVAPGLRTRLGDWAQLNVQLNASKTDTGSTSLGDASAYGGVASVSGNFGLFGWGVSASEQITDYKAGRQTTTDQVNASLSFAPRYDLRLSLRAGRARSDALAENPRWVDTTGWSAGWQPTDHTDISLQGDRTYYGHSHTYSISHRTPRTVWTYIDSNGVSGDANALISVPLTVYDLLYGICVRSGGAPAACDQTVRLSLAQQGVSPTLRAGSGFLNAGITQQHSQTLTTAWSLQRMTASASLFRSSTSALDKNNAQGDLALVDRVRQQGFTLALSHRLTEASSLTLAATLQKTLDAGAQLGNEQRMATLSWTGTLSGRSSASVALRRIDFSGSTNSYRETALTGSFILSF